MIIGVCGFGSTGSSAICDYLKEFEENQVLDDVEFTIAYFPDGLQDLEFHLMQNPARVDGCTTAIKRFQRLISHYYMRGELVKKSHLKKETLNKLTDEFLQSIIQLEWNGYVGTEPLLFDNIQRLFGCSIMMQRIIPMIEKRFSINLKCYPYHNIEFSMYPVNFYEASSKYVMGIVKALGGDGDKNIVLDQPFSGDNPGMSFKYFDNPIAIVVDRDPRDNYLFAKMHLRSRGRFMPTDSVEEFVSYYRSMRRPNSNKELSGKILRIKFEDLIYEYDKTTKIIRDFCGLGENPRPRSILVPEMSMANTQLIRRYPEYKKDIKYIERELKEYLFPFENYPPLKSLGKMFFGKSPLNK